MSDLTPQHPAAPETETDATGWADLLATHLHMPCSQTTPTVSAWWAQCYGCDWKGPRRSHSSARDADHRSHVAEVIATAARERVRVVECLERDAAGLEIGLALQMHEVQHQRANRERARAESAEAAHAAEKAAHDRLRAGVEALAKSWADEAQAGRTGNGHPLLVQTYDGHARALTALLGGGEAR